MPRRSRRKSTPEEIKEMLSLRKRGWSLSRIAEKFGIDHTTVLWHARKHGVDFDARKARRYKRPASKKPAPIFYDEEGKYDSVTNEKVNGGKTYREYLDEERKRLGNDDILDL